MERSFDDTAIGMAANDHVRHSQYAYGIFDGGRNSAQRIGIRRHDVANYAADEQLARFGLGEQARVNTRIGAGDEQRARPLAKGEFFEKILVLRVNVLLKSGGAP